MRKLLIGAALFAGLASLAPSGSFGQSPSPSPSGSPTGAGSASPGPTHSRKDAAPRIHRAIVECDQATFYSWPARDTAPSPASYPPARMGDGFSVIGEAQISYNGLVLYETTIDVVHPWGDGTHYWIAARCVNAA